MKIANPIAKATSYKTSLQIVPASICLMGLSFLGGVFKKLFPDNQVCVIPIEKGGNHIGSILSLVGPLSINPMRMSYYDQNNQRIKKPECKSLPNIHQIVNRQNQVLPVVFTEAVVDSQGTIIAAIKCIKKQVRDLRKKRGKFIPYPEFYLFALASKTKTGAINIKGLKKGFVMFKIHPDIWIYGYGCDDSGEGRQALFLGGRLSPYAKKPPQPPYASALFPLKPDAIPDKFKSLLDISLFYQ